MYYITQLKQNINPTLNDIDLREICRAFVELFTGDIYIIETSYQPFRRLEFENHLSHLHHLLGLHKLSNKRFSKRAEKVMNQIYSGEITLKEIKKDRNFYIIKDRLLMIRLVFLISDQNTNIRLCKTNYKKHIMDLGIIEKNSEKHIVLGVGENDNNMFFFKTLIIDKKLHSESMKIKILKSGKSDRTESL